MSRFHEMTYDELEELQTYYQESIDHYESIPDHLLDDYDDEKLGSFRYSLDELLEYLESLEDAEND